MRRRAFAVVSLVAALVIMALAAGASAADSPEAPTSAPTIAPPSRGEGATVARIITPLRARARLDRPGLTRPVAVQTSWSGQPTTLLVLDATTGQNGLSQARTFTEAVGITGIVLAKLDGTAKGGIAFAIAHELDLPVRFIGTGETLDDLAPFDAHEFVDSLLN